MTPAPTDQPRSLDRLGDPAAGRPAAQPGLRQPQPAARQDRDGRVRHGLHAGALQPGAHRGAVDARDAAQAGDGEGLPGGDPGAGLRSDAGDPRPGRRPRQRQHLQARPLRLPGPRAPRAVGRSIARRSASCTSASACGCRTSATPGSIRCSRCPRRCCTRAWSTTSIATTTPAKPDYAKLWEDIRECIDLAHRDGSIKAIVSAQLPDYVERDEALAETLHKFRSSGKRLFLLTNSAWDYTDAGDELPARRRAAARTRRWRNYFDVIVVSAAKPAFFTEEHPFVELDADGAPLRQDVRRAVPARAGLFGRQHQGVRGRARARTATGCCTSATTSTATCCASASRPTGARRWCCRSWSTRSRCTTGCAPSWRGWIGWTPSCIHLDAELTNARRRCARCRSWTAARPTATGVSGGQAHRQGRDREAARASCATTAARAPQRRERDRRRLQPLLGPAVPRGQRGQQVRRAGRGLRLRLHEPRLQLPLLFADAVLPRPARPHAARTLAARAPKAAVGDCCVADGRAGLRPRWQQKTLRRSPEALEQRRRLLRGATRARR